MDLNVTKEQLIAAWEQLPPYADNSIGTYHEITTITLGIKKTLVFKKCNALMQWTLAEIKKPKSHCSKCENERCLCDYTKQENQYGTTSSTVKPPPLDRMHKRVSSAPICDECGRGIMQCECGPSYNSYESYCSI